MALVLKNVSFFHLFLVIYTFLSHIHFMWCCWFFIAYDHYFFFWKKSVRVCVENRWIYFFLHYLPFIKCHSLTHICRGQGDRYNWFDGIYCIDVLSCWVREKRSKKFNRICVKLEKQFKYRTVDSFFFVSSFVRKTVQICFIAWDSGSRNK